MLHISQWIVIVLIISLYRTEGQESFNEMNTLECCDLAGFIQPTYFRDCRFDVRWDKNARLYFKYNKREVSDEEVDSKTLEALQKEEITEYNITDDAVIMSRSCVSSRDSTLCLMRKMDVIRDWGIFYSSLNFIRMKAKLFDFLERNPEYYPNKDSIKYAFRETPYYREHCPSQKTVLNVIDALLTYCPEQRKRSSSECGNFFRIISKTQPFQENVNVTKLEN